jgi:hypothetical protein
MFFHIPAKLVDEGEQTGRQREFIRNEGVGFPDFEIAVPDAPQNNTVVASRPFIGKNAGIECLCDIVKDQIYCNNPYI